MKQTNNLPVELGKIFKKQPLDEVWISIQGEDNHNFNKMLFLQEFAFRIE